ncbi:AAA family ATPase [Streptomyces sp. NPDC005393]|uniref:AAA family ATPase n=1 Tax=Streptomyces sp. NPDC005393 TaxID=3157041 RepID=UPI00339E5FA4
MRLHRLTVTAFGPFGATQEIDFEELSAAGLFLLHGPTGAGKTSVLDAVCYALYGQVPGARQGSGLSLRSDHADPLTPTEVVLELTAGERRLEITRRPEQPRPRKRGSGTTREKAQSLLREYVPGAGGSAGVWKALSRSHQEIGEEIGQLLGMSREQFCQVVLLPQGDFARFLRADELARGKLLGKLFDTSRFAAVEDRLAELRRAAEKRVAGGDERLLALAHRMAQAAGNTPELDDHPLPEITPGEPGLADAVLEWAAIARTGARERRDIALAAVGAAEAAHRTAQRAADTAREWAQLQRRHAEARRRADDLERQRAERDRVHDLLERARAADAVAPALDLHTAAAHEHRTALAAERQARARLAAEPGLDTPAFAPTADIPGQRPPGPGEPPSGPLPVPRPAPETSSAPVPGGVSPESGGGGAAAGRPGPHACPAARTSPGASGDGAGSGHLGGTPQAPRAASPGGPAAHAQAAEQASREPLPEDSAAEPARPGRVHARVSPEVAEDSGPAQPSAESGAEDAAAGAARNGQASPEAAGDVALPSQTPGAASSDERGPYGRAAREAAEAGAAEDGAGLPCEVAGAAAAGEPTLYGCVAGQASHRTGAEGAAARAERTGHGDAGGSPEAAGERGLASRAPGAASWGEPVPYGRPDADAPASGGSVNPQGAGPARSLAEADADWLTRVERRLREELGALAAARRGEGRVEAVVAEIAALDREARADDEAIEEAADWLAGWEAARRAHQRRIDVAQAAATRAEQIGARIEPAERRLEAARQRDRLAGEAERAREELLRAREETAAARQTWLDLKERRLRGIAAELAAGLSAGEPCAVCGATEHPSPARAEAGHVDRTAEEAALEDYQRAEAGREEAERTLQTLREALAGAEATAGEAGAGELDRELAEVRAAFAEARDAGADGHDARAALDRAEREHERRLAQRQEAERRAAARTSRREALARERTALLAELEQARGGDATVAERAARLERQAGRRGCAGTPPCGRG